MYKFIRPILFSLPPETAHHLALAGLRISKPLLPLFSPWLTLRDARLERKVFGLTFPNPVGLAAGLDKKGELADVWGKMGFGFAELGTFTALPQPGNEGPRVFRFPAQKALINRMGFPNPGAAEAAKRLKRIKEGGSWPSIPIGINIGKSKLVALEDAAEDYLESMEQLLPFADYLVVNVSSPNTPSLRRLQEAKPLKKLLGAVVKAASGKPVLLKIAPDLEENPLKQAADTALSAGCAGLIATNTTLSRVEMPPARYPEGGLSGMPLRKKALKILETLHLFTRGRVPLVGVGGIFTAQDAREMLAAGASLVQVYSGYIYEGPALPARICRGLLKGSWQSAVGSPQFKI